MYKKILLIGISICTLGLIGCKNDDVSSFGTGENSQVVEGEGYAALEETPEVKEEKFDKELVLIDDDFMKLSVLGRRDNDYNGAAYIIYVENKSEKDITVQSNAVSIGDTMEDTMMNIELTSKKKATDYLYFSDKDYASDLKDVSGTFYIFENGENSDLIKQYKFHID